jgi:3-oxoacyl-[acyl-carrier protein] reductase
MALAAEGCRVALCGRTEETLAAAVEEIRTVGGEALGFVCDLNRREEIEKWYDAVCIAWGPPEIVVTNTGGPLPKPVQDLSDEEWLAGFETTILVATRLSELAVPPMIERRWGRIVHITSIVAVELSDLLAVSTTLRSGMRGLTRLQARAYGGHGITVNAVLPGHTLTDRQVELARKRAETEGIAEEDHFAALSRAIPAGRLGRPEEVAAAVAFLCSEPASYINGVSLLVDGGLSKAV